MKLQALLSLCFLGAVTAVQSAKVDVNDVLRNLTSDPLGFKHLGDDGVARSFSPNGTVIDAVGLDPELLMNAAQGYKDPSRRQHLIDLWTGVDGTNVSHLDRYSPPKDLLPTLFTDSRLGKELKEKNEEQRAKYGQSLNKRGSVLDPNVNCFDIVCYNQLTCVWLQCSDCVVYDRFRGTNCI
ncbi:hypothetical protein BDDG_02398 [Blastomyces dermatitidis ATCC 18188]|uniref:Uncharacterized protein n=1 Tax=Ajellomyces dermatitidis (strain ATCC 18188 / CBS 674.68) TaxID=653446 RepID=F2T895_AJEDA|nr:hypothetical protein BDDG_02398 [Blastomyces dermatitidis ATCC 18188]EQL30342.1 hypothetical protein BDFG_07117 [Blastomyces dermatitidis ATCC 26199]